MSRRKHIGLYPRCVKITALCSLLFLVVASGRGFFPQICANLSKPVRIVLVDDAHNGTIGPLASCCVELLTSHAGQKNAPANSTGIPSQRDCPFCNLVGTTCAPLQFSATGLSIQFIPGHSYPCPEVWMLEFVDNTFLIRGPPATLFS